MLAFAPLLQTLLTFVATGDGPVRFGFPLREADLAQGLRVVSRVGAELQWRRLAPRPDPVTGCTWVELAIAPAAGELAIRRGGVGECAGGDGPVLRRRRVLEEDGPMRREVRELQWRDGRVDRLVRRTWSADSRLEDGELVHAGESLTEVDQGWDERLLRVVIPRRAWETAGVLPRDQGLANGLRGELVRCVRSLPAAPGRRGRGDYLRSSEVVTNLEFDTVLGFARLALATGERELLARALASARHLADVDLDSGTGLPFVHGRDHRDGDPESGHAWLQGLLLTGCVAADDALIAAARTLAGGLAARVGSGEGRSERARDFGWPLGELETWLRFGDDRGALARATWLGKELLRRYDAESATIRFGEGERRRGLYEERAWITGGVVLPGLRAYVRRTRDPALQRVVQELERALVARILSGREGLPLRALLRGAATVDELRLSGVPELALLLEGVPPDALARVLQRAGVQRALTGIVREDDPDRATAWSMVARCTWVLR